MSLEVPHTYEELMQTMRGFVPFAIFALLHQHAWRLRDELELNELERYDTRASIRENLILAAVPMASVILAVIFPPRLANLAGLIYFS